MWRWLKYCAFIVAVLLQNVGSAAAEIHALVVGINDYAHEKKLAGAIADADDIAQALTKAGVRSITVLRNAEAQRARLQAAWDAIVAKSKPGDTIIFTYAGHGGSEPWKSETGRAETAESFLLHRFRAPRPTTDSAERVLGKEIKSWFKAAARKNVKILFVADSCHAGGMMRNVAPDADVTYRSSGIPYDVSDTPIIIAEKDEATPTDLAHVTFIAATQADKKIPEIVVNSRKRGALSYAFARALEGQAARSMSTALTNAELHGYITTTVRQLSEAQQTPEVIYRSGGGADTVLADLPKRDLVPGTAPTLKLRLDQATSADVQNLKSKLGGAEIVGGGTADLIWNGKATSVTSGIGDVVATEIDAGKLQGVVDKWRALAEVKAMVAARPLSLSLKPGDARHGLGCKVEFESATVTAGFVTAFNLAPDGSTQYVFPKLKDDPPGGKWKSGEPFRLPLKVESPFGADHLVVIASASPLTVMHRALAAEPPAHQVAKLLTDALVAGTHTIGVQGLYTEAARCAR